MPGRCGWEGGWVRTGRKGARRVLSVREPRSPSGAKSSRASDPAASGPGPDKQPRCRPGPGRAPHPHPISVTLRPERRLEPRPHSSLPLVTSPGALASGPRPGQGGAPMTRPRVLSGGAGGRRAVRPSTSLGTPAPSGPRLAGPAHSTASPALQPAYRSPKGTQLSESLGWPGIPPTGCPVAVAGFCPPRGTSKSKSLPQDCGCGLTGHRVFADVIKLRIWTGGRLKVGAVEERETRGEGPGGRPRGDRSRCRVVCPQAKERRDSGDGPGTDFLPSGPPEGATSVDGTSISDSWSPGL